MKRRKLFGLLALVMVTSIMFIACGSKKTEIDFTVGYHGAGFGQDMKCVVNAFHEWDVLKPDHAMITELDKYNEQFFVDNSLIVYEFTLSYGGGQTEVTKVSRKGKELVVDVVHGVGALAVMKQSVVIIEVSKTDISGTNSLRVATN